MFILLIGCSNPLQSPAPTEPLGTTIMRPTSIPTSEKVSISPTTIPTVLPPVSPTVLSINQPSYPTLFKALDFMDKSKLQQGDNLYMDLMFAPIGWSKDGKFAYITGIDGSGAGNEEIGFYRWTIQDMVTDKCLWQSEHKLEKDMPREFIDTDDYIARFKWVFDNMTKEYKTDLDKYGISIDTGLQLSTFPLNYDNSNYKASLTDFGYEEKYDIPDVISKYKVIVEKDGSPRIFSEYKNKDDLYLDAQIAGYVKSPYEPRVAVALCRIQRGWEGPPHPIYFSFVGCHLKKF